MTAVCIGHGFELPDIFTISGYRVYFWANENNEPDSEILNTRVQNLNWSHFRALLSWPGSSIL